MDWIITINKNSIIAAVITLTVALALGVAFGMIYKESELNSLTKISFSELFHTASKTAEERCINDGGSTLECINLRTTSINDISCTNLAPQNGGADRCGYWVINFTNSTTYPSIRIIKIEIRYNGTIRNVNVSN